MTMIIEPRDGDAEDDASSTKSHSLIAIAGSLLGEISLPKLALAWIMGMLLPSLLLGAAPLIATAWVTSVSGRVMAFAGIGSLLLLALAGIVGWYGVRPLFRMTERSFWSLNGMVVQPGYAACREGLQHLAEHVVRVGDDQDRRARLRAGSAIGAGLAGALVAGAIFALVWPATRWSGGLLDFMDPLRLVVPALANALALMSVYLGAASLLWGLADGLMEQPRDLEGFDTAPPSARRWRVAHLSDVHVVGERYGFRIESGRAGPRGNERFQEVLGRLEAIHAAEPLDLVLITGDMTDAGRSAEWGEFLDAMGRHPALAERCLILPGNHDVNIVDRANPHGSNCRAVRASACARCARSRPWPPSRASASGSSTGAGPRSEAASPLSSSRIAAGSPPSPIRAACAPRPGSARSGRMPFPWCSPRRSRTGSESSC